VARRLIGEAGYRSAETLLQAARQENDPALRYCLLSMIVDLHADEGQVAPALDVLSELAGAYHIDCGKRETALFERALKRQLSFTDYGSLANQTLRAMEDAFARRDYETVKCIGRLLEDCHVSEIEKSADGLLARVVEAEGGHCQADDVAAALELTDRVEPDFLFLQKRLCLRLGVHLCFAKRDWANGLPKLALGTHVALRRIALQELKGAKTSGEQLEFGDA